MSTTAEFCVISIELFANLQIRDINKYDLISNKLNVLLRYYVCYEQKCLCSIGGFVFKFTLA